MPGLLPDIDPEGLLEFSVVYSDRSLNHMSSRFQEVMQTISSTLKNVYNAEAVAVVPGSGTFAMEAVGRQFATGKKCLVLRNGWFSFRWSQIFEMGDIPAEERVLKARQVAAGKQQAFQPAPIEEVKTAIAEFRPDVVFAPHVETSSGMILPDSYLQEVAEAVHVYGGLFVLDCIASGAIWVDMKSVGVDVLISAPQKGWSGSPCCGLVMLNEAALTRLADSQSTSFSCDLKKWSEIMNAYESGGHAYHATMPTDALTRFAEVLREAEEIGFAELRFAQAELGVRVRESLKSHGFQSVAAEGFEAPGVIVSYTDDPLIKAGKKFAQQGVQIAGGVPLRCDEPEDFNTFRIGLFGLEKLRHIEDTVARLEKALDAIA